MWRARGTSKNLLDCKKLRSVKMECQPELNNWNAFQVENGQLRADLDRLRQAVAGAGEGDEENNAIREVTGRILLGVDAEGLILGG